MRHLWLAALVACTRTLDVPPAPGPGSLSGRLVIALPGVAETQPAAGAQLRLLHSNVSSIANADGRFTLSPILDKTGTVLVQFDARADGSFGRQRLLQLEDLGAGPGHDVSTGDVLLRENATVRGRVLRGDHADALTGHKGTTVFVPEGPFTAVSGDDGSWVLPNIPEGAITLAFFRDGYAPASIDAVQVRAGESLSFRDVLLAPSPAPSAQIAVSGSITFDPALADASAASVIATSFSGALSLPVKPDGTFAGTLGPGLYDMRYAMDGYGAAVVPNVLITPGSSDVTLPQITLSKDQAPPPPADAGTPAGPPPPVAQIASPNVGATSQPFTLDASNSSGTPGHGLSFRWVQLSGALVALEQNDSPAAVKATFLAPAQPQTLQFQLTVTDQTTGLSSVAGTTVQLYDPPVAAIGSPVLGRAGGSFQLDASASHSAHAVTYAWRQMAGDHVDLDSATVARPSFIAPLTAQSLGFAVTVTDPISTLSATATTSIAFFDPPVAHASAPVSAQPGATVTLDASLSTGPHALVYSWRQSAGDSVVLSANDSAAAVTASFTAPARGQTLQFALTATDSTTLLTGTATVQIDVQVPPHAALAAVAAQRTSATVQLDATASTVAAGSALSFHWSATPAVTFSANDGVSAGAPTFVAPATPGSVQIGVTVTDVLSGLQDSDAIAVVIAATPVASISPSSLSVRPGATFVLDGSASGPLPLAYHWSLTPSGSGATIDDATVAKPTFHAGTAPFTVSLYVSNNLLASDPVSLGVQINSSAVVPPSLTMPANQIANLSQTVVLAAAATHPDPGATFAYAWTQTLGTPLTLTGASTASLSFVAPAAPDALGFSLTVTACDTTGGCAPATGTVSVAVQDLTPPQVVSTDPPVDGGAGSMFYAKVTFDKALDPASVTAANVYIAPSVASDLRYDAASKTITILPRTPLTPNAQYALVVGAVTDTSSPPNAHAQTSLSYTARNPQWRIWSSTVSSVNIFPGITQSATETVIGGVRAQAGFCTSGSWFANPDGAAGLVEAIGTCFPLDTANSTCQNSDRRMHVASGTVYAQLGNAGCGANGATVLFKRIPSSWSGLSFTSNTSAFSDGLFLHEVSTGGSNMSTGTFDPAGGTFATESVSSGLQTQSFTASMAAGQYIAASVHSIAGNYNCVAVYQRGASSWAAFGGGTVGNIPGGISCSCSLAIPTRMAIVSGQPLVVFPYYNDGNNCVGLALGAAWYNGTGWQYWGNITTLTGVSTPFDVVARGDAAYLAYAKGGSVVVLRMDTTGDQQWHGVNGPAGTAAWNDNLGGTLSCTADKPELYFADDALWATWQESCNPNEYRTIVRKMSGNPSPSTPGLDPLGTLPASCKAIHDAYPSAPSGGYWLSANGQKFPAYCDMTTDGGGWTLAANIINTVQHYGGNGYGLGGVVGLGPPAKLGDFTINALKSGTDPAFRLTCGATKGYFQSACTFNATGTATGACIAMASTYGGAYTGSNVQASATGLADGGPSCCGDRLIYSNGANGGCDNGFGWGSAGQLWVR